MRAVVLCAGMGTRLRPFTYLKPKPLLNIGGKSLLERTITLLQEAGIADITAVLGYKSELIIPILQQHGVSYTISSQYKSHNNHSSLLLVKDLLDDTIIIDGDLYLQKNIVPLIVPGRSQFIAQETAYNCREWEILCDEQNRMTGVRKDSSSGYGMSGVSYWVGPAAKLLQEELDKCGPEEFWEDAAIRVSQKEAVYLTRVKPFSIEIDSLYDAISKDVISSDAVAEQCSLKEAEKLKGLTNNSYLIDYGQGEKVLRIPGKETSKFIDRKKEASILSLLGQHAHITPPAEFYADGIKTSSFLRDYITPTPEQLNEDFLVAVASLLKDIHAIPMPEGTGHERLSLHEELKTYERTAGVLFVTEKEQMILRHIAKELDQDKAVLCHRDLCLENILHKDGDIKLIDFEYSGFSSLYWDIASFITESRLSEEQRTFFINSYGGLSDQRVFKAEIFVDYLWSIWGWMNDHRVYGRGRMMYFHKNFMRLQENMDDILNDRN